MEIVEFPQRQIVTTNYRLSNNGRDETFPKQRIAEYVRSNLGERCPLLSPRAPYLTVPNWRSNEISLTLTAGNKSLALTTERVSEGRQESNLAAIEDRLGR
jgi:hypothetical protein